MKMHNWPTYVMETGRLLKTIEDIQGDEKDFAFQGQFQAILDYYTQNNPDALNETKAKIYANLAKSRLADYVQSDFKILDQLNVRSFFGSESYDTVQTILNSQAHEISKKLTEFIQKRQDAVNKLNQVKISLDAFKLSARQLLNDEYEIGFSFPEEYQNVRELKAALEDINQLLSEIASHSGESADFHISYVNNGSIEVYIQAGLHLAHNFDVMLDYALKVYGVIDASQKLMRGLGNFSAKRKIAMEAEIEAEKVEKSDALLEQMTVELDIKTPETKSRVIIQFKKLLRHFERGVSAEVRTPELAPPVEVAATASPEEKERARELKIQYAQKERIDQRNKEIYKLQSGDFSVLDTKFLTDGIEDGE